MSLSKKAKDELAKPLDAKHVRPPAPGKYGDYIEGWWAISEANRIFDFDGWNRETVELVMTNEGSNGDKYFVGYRAKVRITVGEIVREGTGFGSGVSKQLGDAHESAVKEAETDAMKRALMTFGNPFGLALYDKSKTNVVVMKEKLEGPHSSMSALKGAIKQFVTQLEDMEDADAFDAWMATEEVVALERQAMTYLPNWWETGDGLPAEFVPVAVRIEQKRKLLEMSNEPTPITAAG